MKCHYEVLGLERTVEESEIKTAYRKQALKWHPDKNPNSQDEAKEQFQLVQQAYEVLSDRQERAWYDNHREQILRGGQTDYEDNSLDVFQFFTVTCYKGFSDDSKGFYSVYRDVFNTVATEDIEYMDSELEFDLIPKFGDSKSDYEKVVGPFYAYWQSYCTKKSYAWLSEHNINEHRERRIIKIIEKENKKIQQKARKERNDEIRNLVAFVRKRDKRVAAYRVLLEEKSALNKLKQEKNRIEQIQRRQREIAEQAANHSSIFNEGYEENLKKLEKQYHNSGDENISSDEEELEKENGVVDEEEGEEIYIDDLYCVACNKSFKNHSSFSNHQASKKHLENIERLKLEMLEEEGNYDNSLSEEELEEEEEEVVKISKKKKKMKNKKALLVVNSDEEEEENKIVVPEPEISLENESKEDETLEEKFEEVKVEEIEEKVIISKKKNKKNKKIIQKPKSDDEDEIEDIGKISDEDDDDWDGSKKTKKSKNKSKSSKKKIINNDSSDPEIDVDIDHVCVTCKQQFDSKNKLFQHLKKTKHGVYIPKIGDYEVIEKKLKKKR